MSRSALYLLSLKPTLECFPASCSWRIFAPALGLAIFSIGMTPAVLAETIPDAGALRQQLEQGGRLILPDKAKGLPLSPVPEPLPAREAMQVHVKSFRILGNHAISEERLQLALAPWRNRALDFHGLQLAAAAVAQVYRQSGWVVRSYLPRQDVSQGEVSIQVIEAVFGGVQYEGIAPRRLSSERLQKLIEHTQARGERLSSVALDRALLLLDDLPGISASGNLIAGPGDYETSLLLKTADEALLSGSLSVDNQGDRSTGCNRTLVQGHLASPLRIGDQLDAQLIHSQGSDYGRLAYAIPVGFSGGRIGLSSSGMRYELVAPEYRLVNAHGYSRTLGIDLRYPISRTRLYSVYLLGDIERKAFENYANELSTSRYITYSALLGIAGNLFDSWGGGGANSAQLNFLQGRLNLNANPIPRIDGSNRPYRKIRYSLSRQQAFGERTSLYLSIVGQYSHSNLDSSEKFYAGGPNGVRAYPAGEGGGSRGQLLNFEWRLRLPASVILSAFYDAAQIWRYSENSDVKGQPLSGNDANILRYQGFGLSLGHSHPSGISMAASWARRRGKNPNPTHAGTDQDGSLLRDRYWLNASMVW